MTRSKYGIDKMGALHIRMQERRWLLAASALVLWGLILTYRAETKKIAGTQSLIDAGEVVNLSRLENSRELLPVLAAVYPDAADRTLAASHIYTTVVRLRSNHMLPWSLPNVGYLNTNLFSVSAREAEHGGADFHERLSRSREKLGMTPDGGPLPSPPADTPAGSLRITGRVVDAEGKPVPAATVVLGGTRTAATTTDGEGRYRFEGLARGDSVRVRPIVRYAAFKPVVFPHLGGNERTDFRARENRVGLFADAAQLQRVRARLVVRTPAAYRALFWGWVLAYFIALYGIHTFWFVRRFEGDAILLPVVHLLTGLALMLMFSLQDPLRDLMRAVGYVEGVLAGAVLLAGASRIDYQRGPWRGHTFAWLGLGVVLAALLFVFGAGPTGSDARINLHVPLVGSVQPVEGIKLCLVLFLAGYFARNWDFLRELKQRNGVPRVFRHLNMPRLRDALPVLVGILVAILLFFVLRDMGPALVIACTFLLLYGIVRARWLAVGAGFAALAGVFWFTFHTGAISVVADRVEMMLSPWENFVRGGDHLAHAFWALATGGLTGQGLGAGHPGFIPAAHTDMVLPALGEEIGLLGLVTVFALYVVLIYRAFRISLRARGMYSLFLGLSVSLLLLFQILLIAGGAFGMLPLSGVVTPLISYGKSSMVVHFILLGMLMSLSAHPGRAAEDAIQRGYFERPVRIVMAMALVLLVGVVARVAYIQTVQANAWAIRPALVMRGSGARAYVYNPRILEARSELTRGSIYDRNGIPLATSRWEEIERFRPAYEQAGVNLATLSPTDPRYYPFQALTFYLLGDIRTRVKWGADNSLYAENARLSYLRGYDNFPRPVEKQRTRRGGTEPIIRYDYTQLVSLVRYGPGSRNARTLLHRNRDLYLTVDIRLQARVAAIMAELVAAGKTASAVVLDAATGDVLASVTTPLPVRAFSDPAAAHADPNLFDRGFGKGAKPPGSTFKLVTAIAALNRDREARHFTHLVHASDRYARRHEPTGEIDLRRGLVASSNVFFAALSHDVVGADSLLQTMRYFGFHVGGPSLSVGSQRRLLRAPDNLRQAGFGQGPVTGSPLQVALVSATIAHDGLMPEVHWFRYPHDERTSMRSVLRPADARMLGGIMRQVVTGREGTAHSLRGRSVPVAGKTGTAEEKQWVEQSGRRMRITRNHAWFTGFAPYEGKGRHIAVSVLVEDGGSGGHVAAPVAGAIFEAAADLGIIQRDEH